MSHEKKSITISEKRAPISIKDGDAIFSLVANFILLFFVIFIISVAQGNANGFP
jgi:hypothetical protein